MYAYGHMSRVKAIEDGVVMPILSDGPEKVKVVSSSDAFLKLVYALDPISKLPTGDLCYMVSDKANPEVKAWVLQNIQMDTSSAANLAAPKGLSDDDIIELTRKQGESVDKYAERVNLYLKNNKDLISLYESRTKSNVSSKSSETAVSAE